MAREVEEETSINCKVVKLLYTHEFPLINHQHQFYLCKYLSGTPKLGNFNEAQTMQEEDQTYKPKWIDINKLPRMLVYPLEIRDWFIEDLKNNFKNTPRTAVFNTKNLRQEI